MYSCELFRSFILWPVSEFRLCVFFVIIQPGSCWSFWSVEAGGMNSSIHLIFIDFIDFSSIQDIIFRVFISILDLSECVLFFIQGSFCFIIAKALHNVVRMFIWDTNAISSFFECDWLAVISFFLSFISFVFLLLYEIK